MAYERQRRHKSQRLQLRTCHGNQSLVSLQQSTTHLAARGDSPHVLPRSSSPTPPYPASTPSPLPSESQTPSAPAASPRSPPRRPHSQSTESPPSLEHQTAQDGSDPRTSPRPSTPPAEAPRPPPSPSLIRRHRSLLQKQCLMWGTASAPQYANRQRCTARSCPPSPARPKSRPPRPAGTAPAMRTRPQRPRRQSPGLGPPQSSRVGSDSTKTDIREGNEACQSWTANGPWYRRDLARSP